MLNCRIPWCSAWLILSLFLGGFVFAESLPASPPATGGDALEDQFTARARDLFEKKCSQCHSMEKVLAARQGMEWWVTTVKRMSEKPGSDISRDDTAHIMYYVLKEMPPPGQ
jgi:hypothetical protein